jgi:N-acetylneuraminic acid mutarotase
MYIHGGRDIKEGPMSSMWRLSLENLKKMKANAEHPVSWEVVSQKGACPGKLSHHTAAVFGNSVVVFGGMQDYDNSTEAFEFDALRHSWQKLQQTGDVP